MATDRGGRALLLCLALGAASACAHHPPATEATLRIYLARHGQTDWNAAKRLQGWSDIHLNATGKEQAEALRARLEGVRLDAIYSSTLSRSRETAEIVRGSVPLESLDGLKEQSIGKFEGTRLDGSEPEAAEEFTRRSRDAADALDGGESANQHFERVRATMTAILARHASGSILIVGHGGTNQMILRSLLGLTAEQAAAVRQGNDELYLIEITAGHKPRLWKNVTEANLGDL